MAAPLVEVFDAAESPPEASPTGFGIFLVLDVPVVAAASVAGVARAGAPAPPVADAFVLPAVETPTGRATPVGLADGVTGAAPTLRAVAPAAPIPAASLVAVAELLPEADATLAGFAARPVAERPAAAVFTALLRLVPGSVMSRAGPLAVVCGPRALAAEGFADVAVVRAVAAPRPLVPPSVRTGEPGSDTPSNTSGSSSSCVDSERVGTAVLPSVAVPADGADESAPRSSNAPCASNSSSESINRFEVEVADGGGIDGFAV